MRPNDVARLAGIPVSRVRQVSADDVRHALADRVASVVLDVATQQPATYWLAGDQYWLDDPYFGEVVNMEHLDYNSVIGLHRRQQ